MVASGGSGGPELEAVGADRGAGGGPGCLDGEYSPQSVASADSDKKSSNKRRRDVTGERESVPKFRQQNSKRSLEILQILFHLNCVACENKEMFGKYTRKCPVKVEN